MSARWPRGGRSWTAGSAARPEVSFIADRYRGNWRDRDRLGFDPRSAHMRCNPHNRVISTAAWRENSEHRSLPLLACTSPGDLQQAHPAGLQASP